MHKVSKANEKYSAIALKVRSQEWSEPMGKVMSFSGHILYTVGQVGVPIVGGLGYALLIGSQVLNPDTEQQIEKGFNEVVQDLGIIQDQVEDLRNTAQKTLGMIAEMKWKDGLKRVEAYCKNIYSKKKLEGIIHHIDASFSFFVEIQTDATQHFDKEKLEEYMNFLNDEKGIQECIEFYNYAMALRSQFLSILVLYYSFKNELDEVIILKLTGYHYCSCLGKFVQPLVVNDGAATEDFRQQYLIIPYFTLGTLFSRS